MVLGPVMFKKLKALFAWTTTTSYMFLATSNSTWKTIVKANDMTELRSFSMGLRQETVMKSLRNWAVSLRGFIS